MFIFSCWSLASHIYDKHGKTINCRLKKQAIVYVLLSFFFGNRDAVCQLQKLHTSKKISSKNFVLCL